MIAPSGTTRPDARWPMPGPDHRLSALVSFPPLPALLCAGIALLGSTPAVGGEAHGKTGSVILRMCLGADKVKSLSVMCHSYLDGYLDGAQHAGAGKAGYCVTDVDRKRMPTAVVEWIGAHPESLNEPAAEVLQKALAAHFPCKGRK